MDEETMLELQRKVMDVASCDSFAEKIAKAGEFTLNEVYASSGPECDGISPEARKAILADLDRMGRELAAKHAVAPPVIAGCMAHLLASIVAMSIEAGGHIRRVRRNAGSA